LSFFLFVVFYFFVLGASSPILARSDPFIFWRFERFQSFSRRPSLSFNKQKMCRCTLQQFSVNHSPISLSSSIHPFPPPATAQKPSLHFHPRFPPFLLRRRWEDPQRLEATRATSNSPPVLSLFLLIGSLPLCLTNRPRCRLVRRPQFFFWTEVMFLSPCDWCRAHPFGPREKRFNYGSPIFPPCQLRVIFSASP